MQFSLMDKGQALMLVLFGQCKIFTHIRLQMIIIYLQCKIAKKVALKLKIFRIGLLLVILGCSL